MKLSIRQLWQDRDTPARAAQIRSLRERLAARLGDGARIIIDESNRRVYARDLADIPGLIERLLFRTMPLLVVQPRNTDEIARVVRFANEEHIAIFPRGVASSAYGGPVPTTNGIVIDLSPFQRIEAPNWNAKTITIDAGARWGDVDEMLARHRLALYAYPSNRLATVGGWIAGGGYGINAFKYGHVSNHVAALELVTPQGEIRTMRPTDADFENYFGTEGLMGILTRITLRVHDKSKRATPHLLCFKTDADAFAFVQRLEVQRLQPASIEFYDAHLIHLLNEHHWVMLDGAARRADGGEIGLDPHLNPLPKREREALLPEKPSLLILLDGDESEQRFTQLAAEPAQSGVIESPNHLAGHLWQDRFFPMKIRALGPSLLAAETILPIGAAAAFLERTRQLARRIGISPATECHILSTPTGIQVLAMPMFLTDARKPSYPIHLAFVSLLDRVASRMGGRPYNLGIWHAPFARERYGAKRLSELRAFKRSVDPRGILNPRKFFRIRSRFVGIPGLLLHPFLFKLEMDALEVISSFTLYLSALLKTSVSSYARPANHLTVQRSDIPLPQLEMGVPAWYDLDALARTAAECTSCAACVSVCPAYVHTKDERVTGRAKMWLARRLANGEEIAQSEADAAWLCVRCRACSEVCQTQLPLIAAYGKLEEELEKRFGRPDAMIREFVAGMERDPEYRAKVGLSLPIELTEQRWMKIGSQSPGTSNQTKNILPIAPSPNHHLFIPAEQDESFDLPEVSHTHGGKYHIATRTAPPHNAPFGKFAIDRSDQCISCGQCVEACVYGVHLRNPLDLRRMNTPQDELCRACFRCIQECPRNALTISIDPEFARTGIGAFTPDVILSLQNQSVEGKIPVQGAGYRGAFSGEAFDSMWTDMSEIVRPTRDGIHGREYISTVVDLGRRVERIEIERFKTKGLEILPRFLEIPLPILFDQLPIHRSPNVLLAAARAAQQLGTYAIVARRDWSEALAPYARHIAVSVTSGEIDDFVARFDLVEVDDAALIPLVKTAARHAIVMTRIDEKHLDTERVVGLARRGAEIIHLAFDPAEPSGLFEQLPRVHARLVEEGLRDAVTILASGAIAMAEHTPKTIILGADAVAVGLSLLVALECTLDEGCFSEGGCNCGAETIDPAWGEQRIVNLTASWRNQLLEVLGAMGMREVRRLRGERGRAMLKTELDERLFEPVFGVAR